MRFSKRDVKVFLLGMLAMFLIELVVEWKDFIAGFKVGFGYNTDSSK
jgi:hypothetical protein